VDTGFPQRQREIQGVSFVHAANSIRELLGGKSSLGPSTNRCDADRAVTWNAIEEYQGAPKRARPADRATTAGWCYRSLPMYRYDSLIYRRCDEC